MLAVCLLIVFVVAKLIVIASHPVAFTWWTPLALFWQDTLLVLIFAAFSLLLRRSRIVMAVYGLIVLFIALSLPVARVLGTPLTSPMLRAARGALSDSILYHATLPNVVAMLAVAAIGIGLPWFWRRVRLARHMRRMQGDGCTGERATRRPVLRWSAAGMAALVCVAAGPAAAAHVDTAGMQRNAIIALARSALPRLQPRAMATDWRASRFANVVTGTHSDSVHGAARGANVLLIVLESTAAQYLAPFGAHDDPTPNLTRLASHAMVFTNTYSVYPESVKGLVATLASRYPAFDVEATEHEPLMTTSLAASLSAAGYATGLFHSGRFMYLGMDRIIDGARFDVAEDAGDIGGKHDSSFGIDETAAVARILAWIDARPSKKPFFAAYLPIAGHHPYGYSMDGPFPDSIETGRYRNALHEGDAAIGELLRGLRDRGLDESTVIVVVGDHGEAFGQHSGNYGHDLALYEENVHVPLIFAVPAAARTHRQAFEGTRARVVSLIDIAPGILDVLGLPAPAAFQGGSLFRAESHMALFFTDYSLGLLGLRDGCMKFIYEMESRRSKLFDMCADAGELRDLSAAQSARVQWYRERLLSWSAAQIANVRKSRSSVAVPQPASLQ